MYAKASFRVTVILFEGYRRERGVQDNLGPLYICFVHITARHLCIPESPSPGKYMCEWCLAYAYLFIERINNYW